MRVKLWRALPDQYGHPDVITVLVDFGPGLLDHHPLLVRQRAWPLHVVHLSVSLHALHLKAQMCRAEHVQKEKVGETPLPQNKHCVIYLFLLLVGEWDKANRAPSLPPFALCHWLSAERVWVKSRLKKHKQGTRRSLITLSAPLSFPSLSLLLSPSTHLHLYIVLGVWQKHDEIDHKSLTVVRYVIHVTCEHGCTVRLWC